jgi:purine-binding chemotaxis protein CheW
MDSQAAHMSKADQEIRNGLEGTGQYVTFSLAEEEYGIDIIRVQEIIGYREITKIPNVNEVVKGVLNLRGKSVPVIDLRMKLKLKEKNFDQFTVILILETAGRIMGAIVDSVSDVISLDKNDIQPPPKIAGAVDIHCIKGMARQEEKFIILLDIDALLGTEERIS